MPAVPSSDAILDGFDIHIITIALSLNRSKIRYKMALSEAQELFSLFFAILMMLVAIYY